MQLLLVEDDEKLRSVVSRGLREEGFTVTEMDAGAAALAALAATKVDLVLLDWLLPEKPGIDVLREIRASGDVTPVVMLTALDEVRDRVTALDAGADDYVTKPFAFEELLARVRAVLRRTEARPGPTLRCADLVMDPLARRVSRAGVEATLTAREYELLQFLLKHQGEVLTRPVIVEAVWDQVFDGCTNMVDVYIRYLRVKLDEGHPIKLIHTVRGAGYVLSTQAPDAK